MTLTYDNDDATPFYGLTGAELDRAWLTLQGYADHRDVKPRTVMRWLKAGELPDARKDSRGAWMIPMDAEPAKSGEIVTLGQRPTTRPMTDVAVSHPAGMIDALPSFLTIDQAAQILGISRHAILTPRGRDYFDVVPFGVNGSLVVPLATIKRIRG